MTGTITSKVMGPFSDTAGIKFQQLQRYETGTDRISASRIAAILAADVVGYSRLMGADETGTLVRLNALAPSSLIRRLPSTTDAS